MRKWRCIHTWQGIHVHSQQFQSLLLVDLTLLYVQYTNLESLFPMNILGRFVIWWGPRTNSALLPRWQLWATLVMCINTRRPPEPIWKINVRAKWFSSCDWDWIKSLRPRYVSMRIWTGRKLLYSLMNFGNTMTAWLNPPIASNLVKQTYSQNITSHFC